jgi:hypothetical protein
LTGDIAKYARLARISEAFTPRAPVDRLSLLSGRQTQLMEVISAVGQKGLHVLLFGERGVGKTSLANVLAEIFANENLPDFQATSVNCSTEDTFPTVWRHVFRELGLEYEDDGLSPEDVRYRLARLNPPALIIIDELDRLEDDDSLTLLSDTIKTLSDHAVATTLVVVGVAGSVDELIGEHGSIERAIVQVEMPRMGTRELREILDKGFDHIGITVTVGAMEKITGLSEGLPHFTHLLGGYASERVVADDRDEVTVGDVDAAIERVVRTHTVQSAYQAATRSPRPDNLFQEVLLACALAPKDSLGFFTAGAIRDPLENVVGRRLQIPAFARHLNEFLQPERGSVLYRTGAPRKYFYRFANPLMQPYVILAGLAEGRIRDDQVALFQAEEITDDVPTSQRRLF